MLQTARTVNTESGEEGPLCASWFFGSRRCTPMNADKDHSTKALHSERFGIEATVVSSSRFWLCAFWGIGSACIGVYRRFLDLSCKGSGFARLTAAFRLIPPPSKPTV